MLWGPRFNGDDNTVAMDVQADLYMQFGVGHLRAVVSLRPRPAQVDRKIESLTARLQDRSGGYDHRPLQWAHDLIAAQFRFLYSDWLRQANPGEGRHAQELRIAIAWGAFLEREAQELANEPEYLRAHLDAVEFEQNPIGRDGQERLVRFLLFRYPTIRQYWTRTTPEWPPPLG